MQHHELQPTRLLSPWDSPGKNTGVGSYFLLQGIFLTQGLNLGLLNYRQIFLQSEPSGNRFIEKVYFFHQRRNTGGISVEVRNKTRMPSVSALLLNIIPELLFKTLREIMYMKMEKGEGGQIIFTYKSYDCVSGKTKDQMKNYYNQEDNSWSIKLIQPL